MARQQKIDIESDMFASAREMLNYAIKSTISNMKKKDINEAAVSLKIGISLLPTKDADPITGEVIVKDIPTFDCNIGVSMKHNAKVPVPIESKGFLHYDKGSDSYSVYDDDPQQTWEDYEQDE